MDIDESELSTVNFIPCICFVKTGVAQEKPDKVVLTHQELARVINDTRDALENAEDEEGSDGDENPDVDMNDDKENNAADAEDDENADTFGFERYEGEEGTQVAGIGDIAVIDPNEQLDDEDDDSEAEDDIIKPTDNLIIVGHVDDDCSELQVYVYNEEEGSLYVHHDFILPSYPLCIEWMNYDPERNINEGNYCAIGSMDPVITIWDLDIHNSLEPFVSLGSKGSRKKNIPKSGHTDAVLDLSWNENLHHVLASGSVDQTVLLWDLENQTAQNKITAFQEKVQCVKFHKDEPFNLLTGCCDGIVRLFDCRDLENLSAGGTTWQLNSEVERVAWDPFDDNLFLASANNGKIFLADRRKPSDFIWQRDAHEKEVTALIPNTKIKGMLTTGSADGLMKMWKYDKSDCKVVHMEDVKIGRIQCIGMSSDNPFVVALGGDFKKKYFKVLDQRNFESVVDQFGDAVPGRSQ